MDPEQQAEEVVSKTLEGLRLGEPVRAIRTIRDGSERRGSAGCPKGRFVWAASPVIVESREVVA